MYLKEENHYPKAIAISTVIMGLLLAMSFLIAIGSFQPEEEYGMGGIVVNYGTSVTGMGTDYTSIEEPSTAHDANNQVPDKVVPDQQVTPNTKNSFDAKDIQTQTTEESVNLNTKVSKQPVTPTAAVDNKPEKPTINQNALYKGNKNNGMGKGDGTGNTPGNQGSIDGDPLSNNYGEGGSGFGDKPIELRRFTNLTTPQDDGQKTGKVAVRVTINRSGTVINAVPGVKGTTLSDKDLWEKCRRAAMGATLNKSEAGPDIQTGVVVFNFKVR